MSLLTEVIVAVPGRDQSARLGDLNVWLAREGGDPPPQLVRVGDPTSGAKDSELWSGTFDYLDAEGFKTAFAGVKWAEPDRVQLMLRSEDDALFEVFTAAQLRDRPPAPVIPANPAIDEATLPTQAKPAVVVRRLREHLARHPSFKWFEVRREVLAGLADLLAAASADAKPGAQAGPKEAEQPKVAKPKGFPSR